jgi:hypothetical protein
LTVAAIRRKQVESIPKIGNHPFKLVCFAAADQRYQGVQI